MLEEEEAVEATLEMPELEMADEPERTGALEVVDGLAIAGVVELDDALEAANVL